ncbi:C45 family autoproteolytic acyltransferase/hydolase [Ilumatobacter coccineus]|uniref:Peptidase C45 family protein n=1 Tax=Ilumatobacter coccineus (strain NBRC 103263 / KCTC 29153 / YM16-304) TaxID=1313172 RepID=A0A6C7EA27_ILUCY|nr:C45 family autoproteolytic acyltransferase/hydolase [Ilumatobacter coccineus]BAN01995.1 peptidase C45 family protein [Ilumatobacter coccineus YM16-304]
MRRPPIRILDISGTPEEMGATHGAAFADEIRRYTRDRVALVAEGSWSGGPIAESDVLDIAASMLPAHEAFDASLHAEMAAMADAAGITLAEAVVVGGFTDFVDTVRAVTGGPTPAELIEDDCTAVIVPNSRAGGAGFLAQTWDMHDSATDHVVLLRAHPADGLGFNVFTTTGCLGQIGMNTAGVCVGINNLTGLDGRRGVAWTSVVRGMLNTDSADAALDLLLSADLAGAHNFLVYDRHDVGYNVEAMPAVRPVETLGATVVVHTNHTVYDAATAVEVERPPLATESSTKRRAMAERLLADGDIDLDRLVEMLREPTAICQRAVEPMHIESSGAAVMRPASSDFWACWGRPADNDFSRVAMPMVARESMPEPAAAPVMIGPRSGVRYHHLDPMWSSMAVALESQAFPNTRPEHLLDLDDVAGLAAAFPEGCFVGIDERRVPIATGFGIRTYFDLDDPQHTVLELIERNGGGCGHVPDGDWYYGTSIAVRPDHRRRGIGSELYDLRKQVCRDLGLRGIVAGGVIPGYAGHKHEMSAEEYIAEVAAGRLYDPTLTFQLDNGFEARGALANYMENPLVESYAALIVWHNADFVEPDVTDTARRGRG